MWVFYKIFKKSIPPVKTIFGELPATDGLIKYKGNELNSKPAESRSSYGMGYVPQEENTFPLLTVEENLIEKWN